MKTNHRAKNSTTLAFDHDKKFSQTVNYIPQKPWFVFLMDCDFIFLITRYKGILPNNDRIPICIYPKNFIHKSFVSLNLFKMTNKQL